MYVLSNFVVTVDRVVDSSGLFDSCVGYFLAQFSSVEECYRLVASSQVYLSLLFVQLSTV